MKSYFITGTDTGVGKTMVTSCIAFLLKGRGIDVGIMKPIATGDERKGRFRSEDVEMLYDASGVTDSESTINPVFLPIPASPYDAAKTLGLEIDMGTVFEKFEMLKKSHQMVLVEGIGGLMVPISKEYFVADMIKQMELEAIIVTRSALGTLNHTIMTAEMCKKYGIPIKGLVINYHNDKGSVAERSAPSTLHEITGLPILGTMPFVKDCQKVEEMARVLEKSLDLDMLIS